MIMSLWQQVQPGRVNPLDDEEVNNLLSTSWWAPSSGAFSPSMGDLSLEPIKRAE